MSQETRNLSEFRSVDQLCNEYPDLITKSALRWALRFREQNGLDQHVSKLGKKFIIHVPGFTGWLMRKGSADSNRGVS